MNKFDLPCHVAFLSGYLFSMATALSDEQKSVSICAVLLSNTRTLEDEVEGVVISRELIERPITHFGTELSNQFKGELAQRLLPEVEKYWTMLFTFSEIHSCVLLEIEYDHEVCWQLVYLLEIDEKFTILVVMEQEFEHEKSA